MQVTIPPSRVWVYACVTVGRDIHTGKASVYCSILQVRVATTTAAWGYSPAPAVMASVGLRVGVTVGHVRNWTGRKLSGSMRVARAPRHPHPHSLRGGAGALSHRKRNWGSALMSWWGSSASCAWMLPPPPSLLAGSSSASWWPTGQTLRSQPPWSGLTVNLALYTHYINWKRTFHNVKWEKFSYACFILHNVQPFENNFTSLITLSA